MFTNNAGVPPYTLKGKQRVAYETLWRKLAAAKSAGLRIPCTERTADDYIPDGHQHRVTAREALELCWGCPVMDECGAYAESDRAMSGVWGGRVWRVDRRKEIARERERRRWREMPDEVRQERLRRDRERRAARAAARRSAPGSSGLAVVSLQQLPLTYA